MTCQVQHTGIESLTCSAIESGGLRCERTDVHGADEHRVGEHTIQHALVGNGYACSVVAP